jgi:hypothetical protein
VPTSNWIDPKRDAVSLSIPSWGCMLLTIVLGFNCSMAWAYKTEKICTDVAATAKVPAQKICKIVRVDPKKESAPKEEKKEEKKHGGH